MSTSKKHSEAIAAVIDNEVAMANKLDVQEGHLASDRMRLLRRLAENLANIIGQENTAFDKARFMRACGFGKK